ncbi:hypothetical protein NDU88_000894 [Pleurodeles waltl]|uniref:Uncharacterized protein n=1 Tax=Pleurodeles waltl TaxID=8319 RepID=A0AAV7NHG6_PLEWA|nr:hypothetical protein NDU88_000894 [Pleurodeles waltl]
MTSRPGATLRCDSNTVPGAAVPRGLSFLDLRAGSSAASPLLGLGPILLSCFLLRAPPASQHGQLISPGDQASVASPVGSKTWA